MHPRLLCQPTGLRGYSTLYDSCAFNGGSRERERENGGGGGGGGTQASASALTFQLETWTKPIPAT